VEIGFLDGPCPKRQVLRTARLRIRRGFFLGTALSGGFWAARAANFLQFAIRRPKECQGRFVAPLLPDPMGRFGIHSQLVLWALVSFGLAAEAATERDSLELRFQVDEFVDFSLEEPRVAFLVDRMDPNVETVLRHQTGYRIVSNCDSPRRVVASLSVPIPVGTSLDLELDAPSSTSVSLGARRLGPGAVELLHGVGKVHRQGVRLTYTFRADFTAPVGEVSPTITFSVVP
jgi:hypothetical protein